MRICFICRTGLLRNSACLDSFERFLSNGSYVIRRTGALKEFCPQINKSYVICRTATLEGFCPTYNIASIFYLLS